MFLHFFAFISAFLLLAYHQVTTIFPLFPWNDTSKFSRKDLWLEAGTNGLLMGVAFICVICKNTGFYHYYPLIYYPVLLSGEFFQWWAPFLSKNFSKSKLNFDYEKRYARTIKLFSVEARDRVPDANHIVLHIITIFTTLLVFADRSR